MKRALAFLALLIVVLGAWLWLSRTRTGTAPPHKTTAEQDAAVENALATANPQTAAVIASIFAATPPQAVFYSVPRKPPFPAAGKPQPLEFTNLAPAIVLDNMRLVIRSYGSMFSGNPVGLNSEITSQLNGQNPRQANFIRPEAGMRINEHGELIDPWGTPYFFHQLSSNEMEIRSAGPDKVMWTADDLVAE